jgi:transketolase
MKKISIKNLLNLSAILKKEIIEISYIKKAHHIGSCLSCIDIMVALFFGTMNFSSKNKGKKNDFFIMSKGHAALSYYLVLMKKKFFSKSYLLKNYFENDGSLGGHPDRFKKLGIDYCSGSLGHGISVGCGVALSYLKDNKKNKVFVLVGDGECNEGMIWEAMLFASHQNLYNLCVIVDYNKLQGFGSTTSILNLSSLKEKAQSFKWNVLETNGHDIHSIIKKINRLFLKKNKPNLIIANTIKGKGISFMENRFESHYQVLDKNTYLKSLNEITNYKLI